MAYDYNKYRRKRIESEYQLSVQQMLQTVLIESGTPSGAFFAYKNDAISTTDTDPKVATVTVRTGTFTYLNQATGTSVGLTIDSATGTITPNTSTAGKYAITIDIGPGTPYDPVTGNPQTPGGTYTQIITLYTP
jgi:hypothetical protein